MKHESLNLTKREVFFLIIGMILFFIAMGIVGKYDYQHEILMRELDEKKLEFVKEMQNKIEYLEFMKNKKYEF